MFFIPYDLNNSLSIMSKFKLKSAILTMVSRLLRKHIVSLLAYLQSHIKHEHCWRGRKPQASFLLCGHKPLASKILFVWDFHERLKLGLRVLASGTLLSCHC